MILRIIHTILFTTLFFSTIAQVDTSLIGKRVDIKMKGGNQYSGLVLEVNDSSISIESKYGKISLVVQHIKNINVLSGYGNFRFKNPNGTRYFFGPSAIGLGKGNGYYQNVLISANFGNYGLTRHLSLGGGIEFISTVLKDPIWFLTPKLSFNLAKNLYICVGSFNAVMSVKSAITMPYGVLTYGTEDINLSIGGGTFFKYKEDLGFKNAKGQFIGMLSGTIRVHNNIALLTENYLINRIVEEHEYINNSYTQYVIREYVSPMYIGIHGIRILSRNNTFDIGVMSISNYDEFLTDIPVLPYISYVRSFGKKSFKSI